MEVESIFGLESSIQSFRWGSIFGNSLGIIFPSGEKNEYIFSAVSQCRP